MIYRGRPRKSSQAAGGNKCRFPSPTKYPAIAGYSEMPGVDQLYQPGFHLVAVMVVVIGVVADRERAVRRQAQGRGTSAFMRENGSRLR